MKRLPLILLFLLCWTICAEAANRFWVPLVVTGAVSGTGGLCRLTVNDTANLTAGNAVIVAGILGAVACDGTTTVTTVVDATHVEVNLAFGLAYTSGGTVAGGNWTTSGTGNWASSSGGSGGQTAPVNGDNVTFDGNSGGGTVTVNVTLTLNVLTMAAFTGTLDYSVNNNNITMASFSNSGSAVRTLKMGNGTWTVTAGGTAWNMGTTTNLTLIAGGSTIVFQATNLNSTFSSGAVTYNTVQFQGGSSSSSPTMTIPNSFSVNNLSIASGGGSNGLYFQINGLRTITVNTSLSIAGTSGASTVFLGTSGGSSSIANAGTSSITWAGIREIDFTGTAATATNSFDLGHNTGVTITNPGGGGCILGGYLFWRDLPEHINDNFPAWIERAG